MNNFVLKLIAIITMLIDHIGAILYPDQIWFRYVGRIAFPIFCFLLVEGFFHTKNVHKYMIRLGVFAFVSEIPFDLAFYNKLFASEHQNVFFTLFIGLVVIYFMQMVELKQQNNILITNLVKTIILFTGSAIATLLLTDYTYVGILLIVVFYLLRNKKELRALFAFLVLAFVGGLIDALGLIAALPLLAAMIFISLYNGEKGYQLKYVFYLFYPVHLVVLYFVSKFIF